MIRRNYVNPAPKGLPDGAPRDAVKIDFANRLQRALVNKGWNQSELARRASEKLPRGKTIGRDMVSHYVRGVALPRPAQLEALAKALGVEPSTLLPTSPSAADKLPAADMKALENGNVWLRINQGVPMTKGLLILSILNGQYEAAAELLKSAMAEHDEDK
ncbi:helix-turn-helix domain-containing protein [Methyloceanibacter caenitepidi]|uniref:HTH cro/C1-type domain-containing protein n=1 Tax=Methyloceanibacter caenitepidi TaxID=1384459 RepID=A0A0A8JZW0_9HYPH|nr:helix-turn-helix domain-containing protein [Methyloceanibacter caenitepidi]BAQ16115.1 hypothetical protein GL4_0652 [Methyloceanibacter caenitepidi]